MMLLKNCRKVFLLALILGFTAAVAGYAAEKPTGGGNLSSIFGRITDRSGSPQAGVAVTISDKEGASISELKTSSDGRYSAELLLPGEYTVQAIRLTFLPFQKTSIFVQPGAAVLLNIGLFDMSESIELSIPNDFKAAATDWKWVLRNSYPPRPIFRFTDPQDNREKRTSQDLRERSLRGTLQIATGNEQESFSSKPGLRTNFDIIYDLHSGQSVGLTGSAGWQRGTPTASFRTAWARQDSLGARTSLSAIIRQLFIPAEFWSPGATSAQFTHDRAQSVTLGYEQERQISEFLHVQAGGLLEAISFAGHVRRWTPYGRVIFTPDTNRQLTLSYTTVSPRIMPADEDSSKQNLEQSLSFPQVSAAADGTTVLERGRHLETGWEQKIGSSIHYQAAAFYDSISDTALSLSLKIPDVSLFGLLRDPFSNRYFASGGGYRSFGARVAVAVHVNENLDLIAGYSYAGMMESAAGKIKQQRMVAVQNLLQTGRDHSFTMKIKSSVPASRTHVITSYRWIGSETLIVSDPYNRGVTQSAPYLNIFLLQPLPSPEILPGQFEAVANFTNLLAQGYVPVQTVHGNTGYILPIARSFRGGFNFIF
jgi:hypothetical protein